MEFQRTPNPDGVTLAIGGKTGLLRRLTGAGRRDLDSLSAQDRRLAFALADLRALAADMEEALEISDQRIRLSHRLVAALDARTAAQLGLPPLTDLTLRTDVEGLIGDALDQAAEARTVFDGLRESLDTHALEVLRERLQEQASALGESAALQAVLERLR